METRILKVVAQTEVTKVQTKNGELAKCFIRLKELGNDYSDEYQCALLGEAANKKFTPGQLVAISLRFSTHENSGVHYQDIMANKIALLNA
ncbi:MAG: hypothetical protein ILA03_04090 [Bacteroidaceae bacterium]|nr:hypothetical protein [Bacteroidaceae bacterium]